MPSAPHIRPGPKSHPRRSSTVSFEPESYATLERISASMGEPLAAIHREVVRRGLRSLLTDLGEDASGFTPLLEATA